MKLSESLPPEVRRALYDELKSEFDGTAGTTTTQPADQAGVEAARQAAERRNGNNAKLPNPGLL